MRTRWPIGKWTEAQVAEALCLDQNQVSTEQADDPFDQVAVKLPSDYDASTEEFQSFLREACEVFASIWHKARMAEPSSVEE